MNQKKKKKNQITLSFFSSSSSCSLLPFYGSSMYRSFLSAGRGTLPLLRPLVVPRLHFSTRRARRLPLPPDVELAAARRSKDLAEAVSGKVLAEAAAQKARAEVAAAKEAHAAAELRAQSEAEAAALKARAEVAAAKAARAAAVQKAQAEVAQAEVAAAKEAYAAAAQKAWAAAQMAQAEADAAIQAVIATRCAAAVCLVVCLFLAYDYLVHEEKNIIRWQIKRKLAACLLPPFISEKVEENRLPLDQDPLFLQLHPVLMLGPSGCGKSTQLMDLARQHIAAKTPTFILKLRMSKPSALEEEADAASIGQRQVSQEDSAQSKLADMAHQIFSQIGYPARRSYVSMLLRGGIFKAIGNEFTLPETRRRMTGAIELLFEAAAELSAERRRDGFSLLESAPVLLFDEVQDFVKSSRLGALGGKKVLDFLAMQTLKHCVDTRMLRVAVAGSTALLEKDLPYPARGSRWLYYFRGDPSAEAMAKELVRRGYSATEAARMIEVCGTRLRLFAGPLGPGSRATGELPTESVFLATAKASAKRDLANDMRQLDAEGKARLAKLLDRLLVGSEPPPGLDDLMELTDQPGELSMSVYVDESYLVRFQSQLHRHVWSLNRASRR